MNGGTRLLVVAAEAEARAVLRGLGGDESLARFPWVEHRVGGGEGGGGLGVVVTGIGKVNAAGAVARVLDPSRHSCVISVGVAGALPRPGRGAGTGAGGGAGGSGAEEEVPVLGVVAATACVFADEGVLTPRGFVDCATMGFPLGPFEGSVMPVDDRVLAELRKVAGAAGRIATVSTCSGTDALAAEVVARTGAIAETMEGAAVALVAGRVGVPCGELRVISNTCGDREGQRWDLKGALAGVEGVIGRLRASWVSGAGGAG